MRTLAFLAAITAYSETAGEIMAKVAANMERTAAERRQFVYQQTVHSRFIRTNGKVARQETRQYSVLPTEGATKKTLDSVEGEIHDGKKITKYTDPKTRGKGMDLDGALLESLAEDLVDDKDSRDGISKTLFPLGADAVAKYDFVLIDTKDYKGRLTHRLTFKPKPGSGETWIGDISIDAAEYQPVQIATDLNFKMPMVVRVMFGSNIRQTGFAVSYKRVAENVWFPVSYGSEFRLDLLFGYKRNITMALTSSGFQRTQAESKIDFELPSERKF
jgi:hypothetical protein